MLVGDYEGITPVQVLRDSGLLGMRAKRLEELLNS